MKKLHSLVFLVALCIPSINHAQKPGFYGKKITFQLGIGGHHNTILKLAGIDERNFKNINSPFNKSPYIKSNQFNYSFYGNIGITAWKRAALSLDAQLYFGKKIANIAYYAEDQFGNQYSFNGYGQFSYRSLQITPRLEIFTAGANGPVGLTHILAIGVEIITMKENDFYLIPDNNGGISSPQQLAYPNINKVKPVLIVPTYGLEYRHPLTKSLYLNFGAYAHIHIPIISENSSLLDSGPFFSTYNGSPSTKAAGSRITNLFSARFGLIFAL